MGQLQTDFLPLRHMNRRMHPAASQNRPGSPAPNVTETRAIKDIMELIAHSLCIANSAPSKVAREGWPGKTALLNGQSTKSVFLKTRTKSELHHSLELTDAHWQLIVGLKSQIGLPN